MKSKLIGFNKKTIVRNVAMVATGTAAAQIITLAFAPIITRLYGPEAFGELGIFMSLLLILTPVAALAFPIAIVLPKSDIEARGLIKLSVYVAIIVVIIVSVVLSIFSKSIASMLQIEELLLYLLPLAVLFSAFLQILQQWLIRTKQFRLYAKATFLNALILNASKVGLGWLNPISTTLIILTTISIGFNAILLRIGARFKTLPKKNVSLLQLAKKYRDFPMYRAPQVMINATSQSIPVILLGTFFGPVSAGFFSLSMTVLKKPITLIGRSVGDVLYPRIAEAANNGENLTSLIIKATLALAVIGVVPFGFIVFFGPWLFGLVFGSEWIIAGEYASWLALLMYLMFINRPSAVAIPVLSLQKSYLLYEIISTLAKIVSLVVGFYLLNNDLYSIAIFSIVGVLAYLWLIMWVIKVSKKFDLTNTKKP